MFRHMYHQILGNSAESPGHIRIQKVTKTLRKLCNVHPVGLQKLDGGMAKHEKQTEQDVSKLNVLLLVRNNDQTKTHINGGCLAHWLFEEREKTFLTDVLNYLKKVHSGC